MDAEGDISMTPPATSLRHLSFEETPEPAVTRARLNAVSFKEDRAPLIHDASATFTVGQPAKAMISESRQWQKTPVTKIQMQLRDARWVKEIVQWKNPALSALVLLLGSFCALAGEFILRGDHKVTPLKAISYFVLGDLAVNTLRSMVSSQWQDKAAWSTSAVIASAAEGAKQAVLRLAKLHDNLLSAKDPVLTLRLAGAFCMLAVLSNVFSMWRIICLGFFGVFAWGVTWDMYGTRILEHYHRVVDAVQKRWQALRLSRRQKAIALCVASLYIWAGSGWTTRLQVLLLGALTVRCNLKPAEVTAIISHAEPYVHSAKKRARRLSVAATDYVRRHSFGPVPLKDHEK